MLSSWKENLIPWNCLYGKLKPVDLNFFSVLL